ncbi:MAG TPA: hypothetical protein VGB16_02155 [candidate division Zixibacteria bacterium]
MHLATYIVRIYRSKKGKSRGLVGVVEQIGVKGRKAFTDCDELWEIFCPLKNVRIHKKRENTIISRDKANPWSKL